MPAITVDEARGVLPRIPRPDPASSRARPVGRIVPSHAGTEGAGVPMRRPFPGTLGMTDADPFVLLDHAGPTLNGPGEAKGAQWHPHRGFETVTYMLDGELAHRDATGGGGLHRRGREPVDDRRERHPAREAAHRAAVQEPVASSRPCNCGAPAAHPRAADTSVPVDRHRLAAAPHHPRRRRAHPAHRRERRRLRGHRHHAHADHLRPRHLAPRRPSRSVAPRTSTPSPSRSPATAPSGLRIDPCTTANSASSEGATSW